MGELSDKDALRSVQDDLLKMKVDRAKFCENTAGRITMLENWKREQNGDIKQIRTDLSGFKLSSQKWLIGMLTTILCALALLIVNLAVSMGGDRITHEIESRITTGDVQTVVEKAIAAAIPQIVKDVEKAVKSSDTP